MITITEFRDYLNLAPDADEKILQMCLNAAKGKAREAGISNFKKNAHFDLFICALAGLWYDNRNLGFIGSGNRGTSNAEANSRALINAFVLELRGAKEDDGSDPPPWNDEKTSTEVAP